MLERKNKKNTAVRKRMSLLTGLALLTGLMTSGGCMDAAIGSDSLLRPPRATGDKAAIQDIIVNEAGGSYTLKYPQKGENRSAIILRNEGTDHEYALALYSTEKDAKLNMSIIAYQADKKEWKCIGTYTNTGSGVDRVMFYDINGDKNEEVIIGWTSYNAAQKSLTAYSLRTDEVYEMSIDQTYDELVISDITADNSDDIVLLSLSTQDTASTATLLQYSEQDKRPVGTYSMELDSEVIAFSNILVGGVVGTANQKAKESNAPVKRGVIIDGKRNDNTFCTQMVYFDAEKDELTDPVNPASVRSGTEKYINPTLRSEAVFSRDINDDGIVEIPVVSQMNAAVDENGASVCNQVAWSRYNTDERKLTVSLYTVMNMKDGYYFIMPPRWNGKVTARSNADTREMTFYLWNSKTASRGDQLLTIYRFTEQQWSEEKQEDYIHLNVYAENSKAVFAAKIFKTNADDKLNLSPEEVQRSVMAI